MQGLCGRVLRVTETPTQTLHRLTSYEPGREWDEAIEDDRIVQDYEPNDLETFPWFYKRYDADLPTVELPRDLPPTTAPAVAVLAGTAAVPPAELDLAQLARLLFLSAGVVRAVEHKGRHWLFRAAGSAGARFPLELYVAVPEGGPLPAGVHSYDPEAHALRQVGPPPQGEVPAVVVTGIPWRTGWRYRERGYRHILWDAGTLISQQLAAADSAGLVAQLHTRLPEAEVRELVGADGVHELPVAVVALGDGRPALTPTGPAAAGAVDAAPRELPLVTAAHAAGASDRLGPAWPRGEAVQVAASGGPVEQVVLQRGSQRRMDAGRTLAREVLETSMAAAMRGIDVPHWVAVHGVDDVPPGLYRWPELTTPVRAGDLREEMYGVALEQRLARDAAFVAIGATRVAPLDGAGYREVQLAAGLVEGRLHLLAYAQGAGASGMTFRDSDIPGLTGADVDGLLLTCVGVPAYANKAGGGPGAPVEFRMVNPLE